MKKLMTTVAACALASAVFAQVESVNIVGYMTSPTTGGYKLGVPSFVAVGGGATVVQDLVDTALLTPYVDEIQSYNPATGSFTSLIWDGTGWTEDFSTYTAVPVEAGKGYVMNFSQDTVFAGEVVNGQSLTYTNTIAAGYSVVGSAFPTAMLTSNFNFASVLTAYVDEVQLYSAGTGAFTSYTWDGTGFTADFVNYLPDQLAPAGEGVLFGNNSGGPVQVIESLVL